MPYSVCGRLISSTLAPQDSSRPMASRTAASTSGSIPSMKYSRGIPIVSPSTSSARASVKSGTSMVALVESCGSWPAMTFISAAVSATSLVTGPIWSRLEAKATSP